MASSISLGYHQLAQTKRANDQLHDREVAKIKQNELISNLDRSSREKVAAADRASAEKREKYKADKSYAGSVYSADSNRAASKYSADTSAAASKYSANSKYAEAVYRASVDQAINSAKLKNELDKIKASSNRRLYETALGKLTAGNYVDLMGGANLLGALNGKKVNWKLPAQLNLLAAEREYGRDTILDLLGAAGNLLRGGSGYIRRGSSMAQPSWGNSNLY